MCGSRVLSVILCLFKYYYDKPLVSLIDIFVAAWGPHDMEAFTQRSRKRGWLSCRRSVHLTRIFHDSPRRPQTSVAPCGSRGSTCQNKARDAAAATGLGRSDTVPPPQLGFRACFVSSRRPGTVLTFRASAVGAWRAQRPLHWANAKPGTDGCATCCG